MKQSLIAAVLLLGLAACGDDTEEPSAAPPSETHTTAAAVDDETTESAAELTVGGVYALTVTTDLATYDYDVQDVEAKTIDTRDVAGDDGYVIDVVEFTVAITVREGELSYIGGWSVAQTPILVGPDGTEYEQAVYAAPDQFDGTIAAGETATGPIGFEAPASAAETGVYRLELLGGETTVHEWSY